MEKKTITNRGWFRVSDAIKKAQKKGLDRTQEYQYTWRVDDITEYGESVKPIP